MSNENTSNLEKKSSSHRLSIGILFIVVLLTCIYSLVSTKILHEQLSKMQANAQAHTTVENHLRQEIIQLTIQQAQLQKIMTPLQTRLNDVLVNEHDAKLFQVRENLQWAQINAQTRRSYATSLLYLQQADNLLNEPLNESLRALKQKIQGDIQTLASQPPFDPATLIAHLVHACDQIKELPERKIPTFQAIPKNATTQVPHWLERVKTQLKTLEPFVVIRHHPYDIAPLQTKAALQIVRDQIQLSLIAAQEAVLTMNPALYRQALHVAITHIEVGFDKDVLTTQRIIQSLQSLEQQADQLADIALPILALADMNAYINALSVKEAS